MTTTNRTAALTACWFALLAAGCATYEQGRPAFYDTPGIERIAVWSFGEEEFADTVAEVLVHYSRWTVINRAEIEEILEEQDLQHTERFDAETAVQLGKLAGVDAVVYGKYDDGRAAVKVIDVETGRYHVYRNVYFDTALSVKHKAWSACRYLLPYAIRYEGGTPTFMWCGNDVDKVSPRRLP